MKGQIQDFQCKGTVGGGAMCSTECRLLCKQQRVIIAIFTIVILSFPHHHLSLNPLKKWTISLLTVSSNTTKPNLELSTGHDNQI